MNYDFSNLASLDEKECEWLEKFCRERAIKRALEFGPGNSTIAIHRGGVECIDSFEQSVERAMKIRERLGGLAHIHIYIGSSFPASVGFSAPYDFAFVDGPTGNTVYPPRLNAGLFCFRRAKLIAFHDSNRDSATIETMIDLGMVVADELEGARGIVVLAKA